MNDGSTKTLIVLAMVPIVVGGALWALLMGEDAPASAPPAVMTKVDKVSAPSDWRQTWRAAGLEGAQAKTPDADSDGLKSIMAKSASPAGAKAQLKAWRDAKTLQRVDPQVAQYREAFTAGALAVALNGGQARAVYVVEEAWLAVALCRAVGGQSVVKVVGPRDPLVMSKLDLKVSCGGEELVSAGSGSAEEQLVSQRTLAGWWALIRAQLARSRQKFKDAHRDTALATKLMPKSAAPLFSRGVLQIAQGLTDRGVDSCESALARQDDPWARLFLADVLASMSQPFKAFRHAQAVVTRSPNLAEGHVTLALLNAGRAQTTPEAGREKLINEARKGFERALKLNPAVAGARAGLAQLAMIAGDQQEAEKQLKMAVDEHRDVQAALVLAELLGMNQRADEAVVMLKKLARTEDERVVSALIKNQLMSGAGEEAAASAVAAVKKFPHSMQLALLYADILRQKGEVDQAVEALAPHAKGGNAEQVTGLQVQLLLQSGKKDEAMRLLKPLLAKPKLSKELGALGLIAHALTGDRPAQQALVKRLVSEGVLAWSEIVGALIEAGDALGAEGALRQGLKALPVGQDKWRELAATLAMILTASERKAEALTLQGQLVEQVKDAKQREALKRAMEQAVAGAEAEMAKMKAEQGAGAAELKGAP